MLLFILGLIITGLIVGALGRLIVPGRNPMSIGMTILLGIAASLVAGFVGRALFGSEEPGFLLSVIAAAVIVFFVSRGSRTHRYGARI